MIVGIGIDIVTIARFIPWTKKDHAQLLRVFTPGELEYCLAHATKSAERMAARFAAKEAFYKAIGPLLPPTKIPPPFLTLCRKVEIYPCPFPQLRVLDPAILGIFQNIQWHLSISHSEIAAIATVIVERVS